MPGHTARSRETEVKTRWFLEPLHSTGEMTAEALEGVNAKVPRRLSEHPALWGAASPLEGWTGKMVSRCEVRGSPWETNSGSTSPVNLKCSSCLGRLRVEKRRRDDS